MLEESTTMWVDVRHFFSIWFGLGLDLLVLGLAVYAWTFPCLSGMLDRKTDSWTNSQTVRSTDPNKVAQQSSLSCGIFFSLKLIGQSHWSSTFWLFSRPWTTADQTVKRLIKPLFRDPSSKPTNQIKDNSGE